MIPLHQFSGQHVLVYGCGVSGHACLQALLAGGAKPLTWDDRDPTFQEFNPFTSSLSCLSAIILSPGVPQIDVLRQRAWACGVPIVGDIELFGQACQERIRPPTIVAITGTNGKSTTTAMVTHILQTADRPVHMGGNIGTPVLALSAPGDEGSDIYVLEVSSYQIDLTSTFVPTIAVLLNISPDHIDRHGSFEAYVAVKKRLLERQKHAIHKGLIGMGDAASRAVYHSLYKQHPCLLGIEEADNRLFAIQVARWLGISEEIAHCALESFRSLEHRMEEVAHLGAVRFVNDSKATNQHATRRALEYFKGRGDAIFWIAGGLPKEEGIAPLQPLFPHVYSAYFIGQAAGNFAFAFAPSGRPYSTYATLEAAFRAAAKDAQALGKPSVVLLSPACASFDQFKNFQERGLVFKKNVQDLQNLPQS